MDVPRDTFSYPVVDFGPILEITMKISRLSKYTPHLVALLATVTGCGDSGTDTTSGGTESTSMATTTDGTATSPSTTNEMTAGPTGSESDSTSDTTDTTDPSTTDPSTTDPSTTDPSTTDPTDPSTTDPSTTDPTDTDTDTDSSTTEDCDNKCSSDFHEILDCNNAVVETCMGDEGCDPMSLECINACDAAANNQHSVGCEYYATHMESYKPDGCLAAFVANTWNTPAMIQVEYNGQMLDPGGFGYLPVGTGPNLTYDNFDANAGIAPGEVVILLLSGPQGTQGQGRCPQPSAFPNSVHASGSRVANSFKITSDVPVVAYQLNPYGGGNTAVTAGSLLLPTSAWGDNYIAVNAYGYDLAPPSLNIIAAEDNTTVEMVPVAQVNGGNGIPSSPANTPMSFTLNAGQQAQITENGELTGSVIQSDKPVGLMGGHPCMRAPIGTAYCDHGEQMIPPIRALGYEYVGVMHRPRANEPSIWRVIGAVDGTELNYSTDVGGPATIQQGEIAEFITDIPFVLTSQDEEHPFLLFNIMPGSLWSPYQPQLQNHGDPDYVLNYPPDQYLSKYVFFADPTYPETNLVLVRRKINDQFFDVELDCAGVLDGWQPVGDYEWTRFDLISGDFQDNGACSTGRHEITSEAPFGMWIWGWGTDETSPSTQNVSYGYPAGMNVQPLNDVVIIIE